MLMIEGRPVEVCKKKIKHMYLYVKPPHGQLSVSAPFGVSDEEIVRFVQGKTLWINKQLAEIDAHAPRLMRQYVSGEMLPVWGKNHRLHVEIGGRAEFSLVGDEARLTVRQGSTVSGREKCVRDWYRRELKAAVARLLPKWEAITGLRAGGWQIKYMITRWGTCNTQTGKIWLNLQLAEKTPECLEYVILHELLHLEERKHNARFFALMDQYMPAWRLIKANLNGSQ